MTKTAFNKVKLGAGSYYFYTKNGTNYPCILNNPIEYEFTGGDQVLVFNLDNKQFGIKGIISTSSSDLILLFYDGAKGLSTYGTFWEGLLLKNDIDTLSTQVSNQETSIGNLQTSKEDKKLPQFVLNSALETYKRYISYGGPYLGVAGFITDIHTHGSQKYLHLDYFSKLNKLFGFNVMINGGDIGWYDGDQNLSEAQEELFNTKRMMSDSSLWLFCKGNHDVHENISNSTVDALLNGSYSRQYPGRINSVNVGPNDELGYGYTDDKDNKVRYIYLNTTDIQYHGSYWLSNPQLVWLISVLSSVEADYKVVISMHRCPQHFADWNSYPSDVNSAGFVRFRDFLPDFVHRKSGTRDSLTWDFTNVPTSAKLVCVLSGDAHFNAFQKIGDVNYVVRQGYGNIDPSEMPQGSTRDEFNPNEQCLFDVLAIKNSGTAKVFRIGAGGQSRDLELTY